MHLRLFKMAASCLLPLMATAVAVAQHSDPCALPAGLQSEINNKYPETRVVTLLDLSDYDKRLYKKDHRDRCPGLVKIDFYGDAKPTWALILRKKEPGKSESELLVAQQIEQGWKIESLSKVDASAPVVWSESPGKYEEIMSTKTIVAPHPVIIWCEYGSSAIAYAWINNKIEKVWLSD